MAISIQQAQLTVHFFSPFFSWMENLPTTKYHSLNLVVHNSYDDANLVAE